MITCIAHGENFHPVYKEFLLWWNKPVFVADAIQYGKFELIGNNSYTDKVVYTCEPHYRITPLNYITNTLEAVCGVNAEWSLNLNLIKCERITCEIPENIPNLNIISGDNFIGSILILSCLKNRYIRYRSGDVEWVDTFLCSIWSTLIFYFI